MNTVKQPLSNVQLEILKAFSHHLDEEELRKFKNLIAQFFAEKAIRSADDKWDEKKLTNEDVDKILKTKLRSSKK